MKVGDKIKCDNDQTYVFAKGNKYYTFKLIDELGVEVNMIQDYALEDCLPSRKEEQISLCIGEDIYGNLNYARITEVIKKRK